MTEPLREAPMTRTLLGLEVAPRGGYIYHVVDPEARKPTAFCGTALAIRPRVEVQGAVDISCEPCLLRWLALYARWLNRWRPKG